MNGFSAVNSWTKIAEITDGTSNTVMLFEEAQWTDHSYIPLNKGCNPFLFVGHPSQGMTDSHSRPITRPTTTAPRPATTPAGSTRRCATAARGSSRTPSIAVAPPTSSHAPKPGVFQAISTRNMGEVVSADNY